jgi:transcription initiation factor TFIIB
MIERKIAELIKSFGISLELEENTILRAIEISNRAKEKNLISGRKLEGTAAALIYISGILEDDRKTQKQIAKVASVPESTIRNRYMKIVRELEIRR